MAYWSTLGIIIPHFRKLGQMLYWCQNITEWTVTCPHFYVVTAECEIQTKSNLTGCLKPQNWRSYENKLTNVSYK
jgi:hypothetical protein